MTMLSFPRSGLPLCRLSLEYECLYIIPDPATFVKGSGDIFVNFLLTRALRADKALFIPPNPRRYALSRDLTQHSRVTHLSAAVMRSNFSYLCKAAQIRPLTGLDPSFACYSPVRRSYALQFLLSVQSGADTHFRGN